MKILTKFLAVVFALMLSVSAMAVGTVLSDLNFEITETTTALPSNYTYSTTNPSTVTTQNSIKCVLLSNGGGSTVPTFEEGVPSASSGKRWMAFCPAEDCSVVISVMSNKKEFYIQSKDGKFASYTNTANAVEEFEVSGLKEGEWYVMCGASSQVYITKMVFTADVQGPKISALKINEVEGVFDEDTINVELPYGTDVTALTPVVTLGGTAASYTPEGAQDFTSPVIYTVKDSAEVETKGYYVNVIVADPIDPTITEQPKDATVGLGQPFSLSVAGNDIISYQWYKKENAVSEFVAIPEATSATLEATAPASVAEWYFYCLATNAVSSVSSDTVKVSVVDHVAGTIIGGELSGGKFGTITGSIGGTGASTLSSSNKLDKGKSVSLTLATGNYFQDGDKLVVNISTVSDMDKKGLTVWAGETIVLDNVDVVEGENTLALSGLPENTTTIEIKRTDDVPQNHYIAAMAITREVWYVPSITKFVVAGKDAAIDQAAKTISIELPYGTDITALTPVVTLGGTAASYTPEGAQDFTSSPITFSAIPTVGDAVSYAVTVTASEVASSDATLSDLKVGGTTISGFRSDSLNYEVILPFETVDFPAVTATANDETAIVSEPISEGNVTSILVTAQDGVTTKTYTVTFVVADAPRELTEVVFSNGFIGFIKEGVVTAYYLEGTIAPTVTSATVSEGATYSVEGSTLTVTGSDFKSTDFVLNIQAVTPYTADDATITFDGTESWIKSGYTYDSSKGWRVSKNSTSDARLQEGWTRLYFFVGEAAVLNLGASANKGISIYVNGEFVESTSNTTLAIALDPSTPSMVEIRSNNTSGDTGFTSATVATTAPTGFDAGEIEIVDTYFILMNGTKVSVAPKSGVFVKVEVLDNGDVQSTVQGK